MINVADRRPWSAREYRILKKCFWDDKTARLLGRSENEVFDKVRRECDTTFSSWYRRHSRICPGAPDDARVVLQLAHKICRENFFDVIDPDEVENIAIGVLGYCFATFYPEKGKSTITPAKRFLKWFRHFFRLRVLKIARRLRQKASKRRSVELSCPRADHDELRDEYTRLSRNLLQMVLDQLSPTARTCIELRLAGAKTSIIAQEGGLAPKTVSNMYSQQAITDLVRKHVREIVCRWPQDQLRRFLAHLGEVGLSAGQVSNLLCTPLSEVGRLNEAH